MIDLPDHGYVSRSITMINAGGIAEGSLGGPSDYIDRPGQRYSVRYELPPLPAKEARLFEALLEQGLSEDVSYPFPLDQKAIMAGPAVVDGSTPPGAALGLKNMVPGAVIRSGQAFAVVLADGSGTVHKAKTEVIVGNDGKAALTVFPWIRTTLANGLTVEIEKPRIRGVLQWEGSTQGSFGRRGFNFMISERR